MLIDGWIPGEAAPPERMAEDNQRLGVDHLPLHRHGTPAPATGASLRPEKESPVTAWPYER